MASLLGAKMLFLIRYHGKPARYIFSTGFVQSHLNRFYLYWARNSVRLGSEHGPVGLRIVVWLDSGLVSLFGSRTQHEDDDDDWGFRARRLQRSFCAHNYRIITPQRERKIKKRLWQITNDEGDYENVR